MPQRRATGVFTITTVIDGSDGYSSAIVRLYRRSATVLTDSDRPKGTLTYTFATGVLSGPSASFNGWSQQMPAGDADTKLYVTMATARSREATDDIIVNGTATPPVNEWSSPVEYSEGMHSATVMLYKRSATPLTAHGITAAVYYRFSDGKLFSDKAATTETAIEANKLSGWTRTVPETDGNPLYQIQATAVGIDDLDKIGSGEWSEPVKMVQDGESVLIIDIDNDNDQFGVDADGKVLVQQTRSTVATLLYGTEEQAFLTTPQTSAPSASLKYDNGDPVPTSVAEITTAALQNNNKEYLVTVTIKKTADDASPVFTKTGRNGLYVDITGSCAKGGPKTIRFSLEKVMSGEAGVSPIIYQLAPTQKGFSFGRGSSNNLTPSSRSSQINVAKTGGNTTTILSTEQTGITYKWGWDENTTAQATGQAIGTSVSVSNTDAASHNQVWVQLVKDGVDGDRETLPITKDGTGGPEGQNAIRLALDNEHEDFLYSDAGLVAPANGATSQVRLYDGQTEKTYGTSGDFTAVVDYDRSSGVSSISTDSNYAFITNAGVLTVKGISTDTAKVVVKANYKNAYYRAEFTANKTSQDKYDLVVKPNAIAFNSSDDWPEDDITIALSADRTDLQGNKTANVTIQTTEVDGLRLYYSYVKTDGTLLTPSLIRMESTSFTLGQGDANTYIGIYFELRLYSGNNYRMCDYETVEIAKAENGAGQPDYIQTQEAWSNQAESPSETTMPSDCQESDWKDITPPKPINKAYLWRRSRKMVLQSNGTYAAASGTDGQWKYTRLSGTNGTSIKTKGTALLTVVAVKDMASELTSVSAATGDMAIVKDDGRLYKKTSSGWVRESTAVQTGSVAILYDDAKLWTFGGSTWSQASVACADGDAYVVTGNYLYSTENILGHLFMYSSEAGEWIDLGQFKGDPATTYYTHIAWATTVTFGTYSGEIPAGQITTPNATAVTGGSITPSTDGSKPYMGILINTNSGTDETTYTLYTWTYAKGPKGDSPWVADLDNEMDSISCDDTGHPVTAQTASTGIHMYYGSESKAFGIHSVTRNGTPVTIGTAASGVTVSYNAETHVMSVTYAKSAKITGKDEYIITLRPSGASDATLDRPLRFIVNGIIGDVYNLNPSVGQINVASGITTFNLSCGYTKNVNGTVTEHALAQIAVDNYYVDGKYNVYYRLRTKSSGAWANTYTKYTGSQLSNIDIATYDNVELVLCTATVATVQATTPENLGSVIDRETVPVVRDGSDGSSDSIEVTCLPGSLTVPFTSAGAVEASTSLTVVFGMAVNGAAATVSSVTVASKSNKISVAAVQGYDNQKTITVPVTSSGSAVTMDDVNQGIVFTVTGTLLGTSYQKNYVFPMIASKAGDNGKNTTSYWLVLDPNAVNFRSNAVGEFSPASKAIACSVWKRVGSGVAQQISPVAGVYDGYTLRYRLIGTLGTSAWTSSSSATVYSTDALDGIQGLGPVIGVEFAIGSLAQGGLFSDIVFTATCVITCDGRRGVPGEAGAIGKMFFPMGEYVSKEYTRTDDLVPLVFLPTPGVYNEAIGAEGDYWYLYAESNNMGTEQDPNYVAPSSDPGNPWRKCNQYGVVITQGLFAEFAKLGKGIFSGDYLFSMNGRIGNTEYNNGQKIGGRPAYTYFLPSPQTITVVTPHVTSAKVGNVDHYVKISSAFGMVAGKQYTITIRAKSESATNKLYLAYGTSWSGLTYLGEVANSSYANYTFKMTPSTTSSDYYIWAEIGVANKPGYIQSIIISSASTIFEPNWWVDLLTGKMSAARGNFVVDGNGDVQVSGTVKAKNLYHRLALTSGRVENNTVEYTFLLDDNSNTEFCVYCYTSVGSMVAGQYYIGTSAELDALAGDHDYWRDENYQYCRLCTGPADEVIATINNGGGGSFTATLHLPRCEDYVGKMVTVRHNASNITSLSICQVDEATNKFGTGPTINSGDIPSINPGTTLSPATGLVFGETAIFYSTGTYWLVLSKN